MEIGTKMGFTLGLRWGKKEEGMLVEVEKWDEKLVFNEECQDGSNNRIFMVIVFRIGF